MKVSDYKIITAANPKKVANAVMAYLNDGWELFGPPFQVPEGIGQAVVKRDALPPDSELPSTLKPK
jgi:hypothetical protein